MGQHTISLEVQCRVRSLSPGASHDPSIVCLVSGARVLNDTVAVLVPSQGLGHNSQYLRPHVLQVLFVLEQCVVPVALQYELQVQVTPLWHIVDVVTVDFHKRIFTWETICGDIYVFAL